MHNTKHSTATKQKISETLREIRSNGISDLHKHKISETKRNEIEKIKHYYSELEKNNNITNE
jgi:hypothetical protein